MQDKYMTAKVVISNATYAYDNEYSYYVGSKFQDIISAGMRVLVPFGRGNRKRIGFITRIYYKDQYDPALKPLLSLIDSEPVINDEMMKIIFWMKENTFCTYFEALRTIIPTGLNVSFNQKFTLTKTAPNEPLTPQEAGVLSFLEKAINAKEFDNILSDDGSKEKKMVIEGLLKKGVIKASDVFKRKIGDETIRMVKLSDSYLNNEIKLKLTPKQNSVIELLEENGCASVKEICYLCSITSGVINTLVTKKVVETFEYETFRIPNADIKQTASLDDIKLSDAQTKVYNEVKDMLDSHKAGGALLHGVTGSGKTSVFIKLIEYTLSFNKTAILLIPEISLTPQMITQFKSLFGDITAVIHSSLSIGQRADEYKRIKQGKAKIVIGTRSAVFAPLDNIGIIIMDEEGERTYKSESSPRYHARDIAILRCGWHKATLLMASATPSIDSYYYAKRGRFKLLELTERYSDAKLPDVVIADMQLENEDGNKSLFCRGLIAGIKKNLENKEQTILLLNRRGYYVYITCLDCREPISCPNCNIPLTYHKINGQLMCHYCGYTRPLDEKCPNCSSTHLKPSGTGTQKLEDEIALMFPEARVLRMDADTTYSRYSYEKNFADFADGKYDIMIGTQMIAKGLDFPNVTLVGVISLDKSLFMGDFRSYERTFSLITQVVGRSGRGQKKGTAYIQTYVPEHYVLNLAAKQDYKEFYQEEITMRKALIYPPFCDICVIGFTSVIDNEADKASKEFVRLMKNKIETEKINIPLRLLGPSKCVIAKINNKFRYRIIIKCKNSKEFRKFISELLAEINKNNIFSNTTVYVDINGDIGI